MTRNGFGVSCVCTGYSFVIAVIAFLNEGGSRRFPAKRRIGALRRAGGCLVLLRLLRADPFSESIRQKFGVFTPRPVQPGVLLNKRSCDIIWLKN